MLSPETIRQGQHVMAVCNACRYCEGYCPVFPAMENRLAFAKGDLAYLANLCHDCGECLYACQFAPPHEFGIDVPRAMAEIRLGSYEEYAWPASFGGAFRRQTAGGTVTIAVFLGVVVFALCVVVGAEFWPGQPDGDFYAVLPHGAMVGLFGVTGAFSLLALAIGCLRAWRSLGSAAASLPGPASGRGARPAVVRGLSEALTLRHLHTTGVDCTDAEEQRSPWRRRFHHMTMCGFALCFASTSVAALYHTVFGWRAPYAYASLPVVLGTAGGVGLLLGPVGLFALRRRRDRALLDPAQDGLDRSFMAMLFMTGATGLVLLVLRGRPVMPLLLALHLGFVLALFVTLPYGKFVHGLYRAAALVKYAAESPR